MDYSEAKKSFSWTIVSSSTVIKELDRSVFIHQTTGIPREMRVFFNIDNLARAGRKDIFLQYKTHFYKGRFEMTKNARTRLCWSTDFSQLLHSIFPQQLNV